MFGIFLSALIPGVIVMILRNYIDINIISVFVLAGFFILVYILLFFLFKCLDKNDTMILDLARRKIFGKPLTKDFIKDISKDL